MVDLNIPERRNQTIYAKITETNKSFVADLAAEEGVSEAELLDLLIENYRMNYVSNKAGVRKRSRKTTG